MDRGNHYRSGVNKICWWEESDFWEIFHWYYLLRRGWKKEQMQKKIKHSWHVRLSPRYNTFKCRLYMVMPLELQKVNGCIFTSMLFNTLFFYKNEVELYEVTWKRACKIKWENQTRSTWYLSFFKVSVCTSVYVSTYTDLQGCTANLQLWLSLGRTTELGQSQGMFSSACSACILPPPTISKWHPYRSRIPCHPSFVWISHGHSIPLAST